jgi:hypothetical protein
MPFYSGLWPIKNEIKILIVQQYKICRSSFGLLMVSIKLFLFVRPEAEDKTA